MSGGMRSSTSGFVSSLSYVDMSFAWAWNPPPPLYVPKNCSPRLSQREFKGERHSFNLMGNSKCAMMPLTAVDDPTSADSGNKRG